MRNNKYVVVTKDTIKGMCVATFIVVMVLTSLFFVGYNLVTETVMADESPTIKEVEVIEERIVPVINEIEIPVIQENVIDVYNEKDTVVTVNGATMRKLGDFRLTSYCPCNYCCGVHGGSPEGKIGSIGLGVYEGLTVAVDPSVIPYGSKIYIEGVGVRIATDCGVKGNRIDVYVTDHSHACDLGVFGGYAHGVWLIDD